MSELINNHIIPRTTTIAGNYNPLCILTSFLRILLVFLVYTSQKINFHGVCVKCSIIDLLAPATGKSLSCGQLIRITGISPLRGSLRAVSGSTIIILAVFAYMRSCLMVCDGILAPPSVTLSKAGGSWRTSQVAITRTDVSVLAYSIVNVQQRSLI